MRRPLAILFTLALLLAPLAELLPGAEDARLPACCRRHGMHHCSMDRMLTGMRKESGTAAVAPPSHCPLYSIPGAAVTAHFLFAAAFSYRHAAQTPVAVATLAQPRIAPAISRTGRAPPSC